MFKTVSDIKTNNKKAETHPVTYYLDKEKKTLARTNSSTIRSIYKPNTHKVPTYPERGYRELVNGIIRKLNDEA